MIPPILLSLWDPLVLNYWEMRLLWQRKQTPTLVNSSTQWFMLYSWQKKEAGSFPSSLTSSGWPNFTCPSALQNNPKLIKGHCVTCSAASSFLTGTAPGAAKQNPIVFLFHGFLSSLNCLARWGRMGHEHCQLTDSQNKSLRCFGRDIFQKRGLSCFIVTELKEAFATNKFFPKMMI